MPQAIFVTRPFLPPLEEFLPLLRTIWDSHILTNSGPFHAQFEAALSAFLEVSHVSLVANGMLALASSLEAADLEGEVITTPYSFAATSHALKLGGLEPVFVDVRRADLNIDPARIEDAITPRTSAIMAVHVYGNPCAVAEIEEIAARHRLKVIYDGAHAFGSRARGRSVLSYGDFSIVSFHATKILNTFEGGAVISGTSEGAAKVERFRNFGIEDETSIPTIGTNAKMSEFNAALGLMQLEYYAKVRAQRQEVFRTYCTLLQGVEGIELLTPSHDTEPNFSHFPILVTEEFRTDRDAVEANLASQQIFARKYFFPLLSDLSAYRSLPSARASNLAVAARASRQVLCLPIYPGLTIRDQHRVVEAILTADKA